jgi:hypothetical protein
MQMPTPARQSPTTSDVAYERINEKLSDKGFRVRFQGLRGDTLWFWLADREKSMTQDQLMEFASQIVAALREPNDLDINAMLAAAKKIGIE